MRKINKTSLVLILLLAIGVGLFHDLILKEVVLLKNGQVITAEKTWETGQSIFYEKKDNIHVIPKDQVVQFGGPNLTLSLRAAQLRVVEYYGRARKRVGRFIEVSGVSGDQHFALALGAAALALVSILVFTSRLLFRGKTPSENRTTNPKPIAPQRVDDLPSRLDIVRFFLSLFREQIGAPEDSQMEFVSLNAKSADPNAIYELRVKPHNDWVTRRMSIGPLGEEGGSKSICYYVIYDDHLVVKIPPRPITDFEQYVASIKQEQQIVDKLAPKECITPKVSVILNLIHKFPEPTAASGERLEEKYIAWLRKKTAYQRYLKINHTFVYFMDMSKYYFLVHILDKMHAEKLSIESEVGEHPELLWEADKFKDLYGEENEIICLEIQGVFNQCEAEIRRLLLRSELTQTIAPYQIQGWITNFLAGKTVSPAGSGLPPEFVQGLNASLNKVFEQNHHQVQAYRNVIRGYLDRKTFQQKRAQIAGLISNLLELLAWLRKKKVSLRDLKPDNLFVAGDPAKYPMFLRNADEYSLGIIDVETAVDFERAGHARIKQPLLGGTPFFATPSHFMRNEWIIAEYRSLGEILHLQDWHAVLVMIYKVITGNMLFDQTAKLFGGIKSLVQNADGGHGSVSAVVQEVSWIFWRSACAEFQMKTCAKEAMLKSVPVSIVSDARLMMLNALKKDLQVLSSRMKSQVSSQSLFSSPRSQQQLLASSETKLRQLAADMNRKLQASRNPTPQSLQALRFLEDLAELKTEATHVARLLKRLDDPEPRLAAFDLMTAMFQVLLHGMYQFEWRTLGQEKPTPVSCTETGRSFAATI
jgi:serine/threonine protein kinase